MARFLVASRIWDITATMDLTLMQRVNLRKQWMVYLFAEWVSKRIWCKSYSDQFGNSQRSLLSPTGGVKSIPPTTDNWLRKLYIYSLNNDTSTEDKHETNHINNIYNDMNMNTRNMHNTWAWTQARSFRHTSWCFVTCTSWLKCSWVSFVIHVHDRFSLSSPSSLSTSVCPSPSSLSSSFSCTSSCTLSSTNWSPCKTCAPPRTRGVTTPTTSPSPSQVMSPTTWPSASSTTRRVPSPPLHRHQSRTWMTRHSASRSPRHTEDKPITAIRKSCQSVSQSSLSVVFDRTGKPVGERDVDHTIGFGVTRNTYSAHSNFSENTQAEEMVDRTGKPVERNSSNAQN